MNSAVNMNSVSSVSSVMPEAHVSYEQPGSDEDYVDLSSYTSYGSEKY